MQPSPSHFILFIRDACVLVVVAYLLTRGRMLRLLFQKRLPTPQTFGLGITLGLMGLSETLFQDAPVVYATHTLSIAFATMVGGLPVGLIAATVITLGVTIQRPERAIAGALSAFLSVALSCVLRRVDTIPKRLTSGFLAGAAAQTARLILHLLFMGTLYTRPLQPTAIFSIPYNGFGVALLVLVVCDAQVRADSEERRLEAERRRGEAERAHALAFEAQLTALRARIHPHFLFNALNSIAELCCIAPERAEIASINLSRLMRRALETHADLIPLQEELALVQAYLDIEKERIGERLHITWCIDPACTAVLTPPFSVQTLVENAIHHGIGPREPGGEIVITVRGGKRRILVAVQDNGAGMSPIAQQHVREESPSRLHGLQILDQQLAHRYGSTAHLRLFSQESRGTLVAFALPIKESDTPMEIKEWK
ncbi:MAG: signal transduction histidine kinase, LytS [Chthonomonadales bacterium]|nr:signal transduction histidine kinase, LytS [Chthonomonadales bacterium]